MKCLIPVSLIILRLSIMLIPYLVLYRLSNCFNLAQGKLSQLSEQYLVLPLVICSQFLILQVVRHVAFRLSWLSILKQPGHVFFSRMYPQQNRQFIPHGAIKSAGIDVVFFRWVFVMTRAQFLFSIMLSPQLPRPFRTVPTATFGYVFFLLIIRASFYFAFFLYQIFIGQRC
jgi:hypothetical protein